MTQKIATVIGNGKSRQSINLNEFRKIGPLFGCNAIFRTEKVDWLVAIDDKIIGEVLESSFPIEKFIVPPLHEQYEPLEYSPFGRRENAGMVAMKQAIKRDYDTLYCIGFDFLFEDAELNSANIYDGTFGYELETRASVQDCINRVLYLDWFASKHSQTNFYFIYPISEKDRKIRHVNSPNIFVSYI